MARTSVLGTTVVIAKVKLFLTESHIEKDVIVVINSTKRMIRVCYFYCSSDGKGIVSKRNFHQLAFHRPIYLLPSKKKKNNLTFKNFIRKSRVFRLVAETSIPGSHLFFSGDSCDRQLIL